MFLTALGLMNWLLWLMALFLLFTLNFFFPTFILKQMSQNSFTCVYMYLCHICILRVYNIYLYMNVIFFMWLCKVTVAINVVHIHWNTNCREHAERLYDHITYWSSFCLVLVRCWLSLWGSTANAREPAASLHGVFLDIIILDRWISIHSV